MNATKRLAPGFMPLGDIATNHHAELAGTGKSKFARSTARPVPRHHANAAFDASERLNRYCENMGLPEL